jgi:hypothetical protein
MKAPVHSLSLALVVSLLPTAGCELLQALQGGSGLEIPVLLESPAIDIDVTTPVLQYEEDTCQDENNLDCVIIQALDLTDDDQISDPPRIPEQFPAQVRVTSPLDQSEEIIDVEEWAQSGGMLDDVELAYAIDVDLKDALEDRPPEAVDSVSFRNLRLNWQENSLTFDTLPFDFYVATEILTDAGSATEMIEQGLVTKVGTVPSQGAEATGEAEIVFEEGGEDLFADALRSFTFTLVVAIPADAEIRLNDGDQPGTKRKPLGLAKVSIKGDLIYTLNPQDLLNAVEAVEPGADATETTDDTEPSGAETTE